MKWQDRIPDTEVMKKAGMQNVDTFSETGTVKMDRPCYQAAWGTFSKENPLWITRNGQTLPWWSEEAIQRHPQSLPQGFQHTNRVMGRNCTGPSKVARHHQKSASEYEAKRSSEAEQKRAQRKARARPYQKSCLALTSVVPSATDSLELELV